MTITELQEALNAYDDGVLRAGAHQPGGREFCALEFDAIVRGRSWSDAPLTLPDLRPLNDGHWSSDAARTAALLPVMVAYWDWAEWSSVRRRAVITRIVIKTVRQIIADLPGLSDAVRDACRAAETLEAAEAAAWAAARAAAWAAEAAWAAAAAARASEAARAAAAAWVTGDLILAHACQIWITAAGADDA